MNDFLSMNSFLHRFRLSFNRRGFSLVEMMACVSIIGIISFMAIPSVTRMRGDSERNLVIARAQALNLAQASYVQVRGRTAAALEWTAAGSDAARYNLVRPYLSYPENTVGEFLCGYTSASYPVFSTSISPLQKVTIVIPGGGVLLY